VYTGGRGRGAPRMPPYLKKLDHKIATTRKIRNPLTFSHNPKFPPQKNLLKTSRTLPPRVSITVHLQRFYTGGRAKNVKFLNNYANTHLWNHNNLVKTILNHSVYASLG